MGRIFMTEKKPLIAVKFCGGCNPTYDRGAFFAQLKAALDGQVTFVPYDHPSPDGIIIICGCERVCPVKHFDPHAYKSFTVINKATDPKDVAAEISKQHL